MEPKFETDADRPLLEQFEERAMVDDEARDWLFTQIYANPDVMSLLCGLRLPPEAVAETGEVWRKIISQKKKGDRFIYFCLCK